MPYGNDPGGGGGGPADELDANGTTLTVDAIPDGAVARRSGTSFGGDSSLTYVSGVLTLTAASVGGTVAGQFENSDNTNGASNVDIEAKVGGTSGGDPRFLWTIPGGSSIVASMDNSASDAWLLTRAGSVKLAQTSDGGWVFNRFASAITYSKYEFYNDGTENTTALTFINDSGNTAGFVRHRFNLINSSVTADVELHGSTAATSAFGISDAKAFHLLAGSGALYMKVGTVGTAPLVLGANNVQQYKIDGANGNHTIGIGDLAVGNNNDNLFFPSCNGTPTSTPTVPAGYVAVKIDRTAGIIYLNSGSGWAAA